MPPRKGAAKPAAKAEPPSQTLPSKEAATFKQILKLYETKKYPKALKQSDQILKKFPEHGETLAMKGLIINNLKKKDEAEHLVKKGLALNPKSHVCWHVYGLLHRSNRDYDSAIKCYQQAIKLDKDNLQILKDLSNLQVQRRMYSGFQETRRRILILKSNNKQNWLAYAIGAHLSGDFKKCVEIIDAYSKVNQDKKGQSTGGMQAFEDSEFLLYRNMVLEESGNVEATLKHLETIEHDIVDRLYWREKKAKLLLQLGKIKEAEAEYRALLEVNPEENNFHQGLRRCLGLTGDLTGEQMEKLIQLYDELQKQFPKSQAAVRRPLDFLSGSSDQFKKRVDNYLRNYLRKGIPSLFRDIRPLYSDASKVRVVEDLIQGYLTELKERSRFRTTDEPDAEVPSALLFTLMFTSEHYDHLHDYSEALKFVNEAIAHTPTNLDLYILRARIYKHAGDMETAFHWMDFARKLDTADRYLNTKCVRYALRADRLQDAQRIVSYFLRDGDSLTSLYDMQCMWYENNIGDSYLRLKEWGRALRKWHAIDEHFETIFEDQFDFHNYCLRKMTLRAYIDMLRWQDNLRSHRFYFRAAQNLVRTYLMLHDNPALADKNKALADKNLTAEEKKQLKKELRAAKKKEFGKDKEEGDGQGQKDSSAERLGNQIAGKKGDDDPDGVKLVQTKDPLGEGSKFLKYLQLYRPDEIQTHLLSIQVYTRKKKYLLVLRALKKALAIERNNPQANLDLILTLRAVKCATLDPLIQQVVELECKSDLLGGDKSPSTLVEEFLSDNKGSLPHRLAGAKALVALESKEESKLGSLSDTVKQRVIQLCNLGGTKTQRPRHEECQPVYDFLLTIDSRAANDFKRECSLLFPLTPFFKDSKSVSQDGIKAKPSTSSSSQKEEGGAETESEKSQNKKKTGGSKSRTSSETTTSS